jgi:hypothetical protein
MSAFAALSEHWDSLLIWGFVASMLMATVLEGAQLLGLTRMSLPFLFGTSFVGARGPAMILGYVLYALGGWVFAFIYAAIMESVGIYSWWFGALIGLCHGAFLVTVFLPLLPYAHPRMATEYSGPDALRRLEPPGAFGLNYGRTTPASTMLAQILFGLVFALGYAH